MPWPNGSFIMSADASRGFIDQRMGVEVLLGIDKSCYFGRQCRVDQ